MGWILWKSFLNKNIVCGPQLALRSNMLPDKKLSTGLNLFSSEYRWIGVVGRICCSMYLIFEIRTKYSILSLFFYKTSTGLRQATHLITFCKISVIIKKTNLFSLNKLHRFLQINKIVYFSMSTKSTTSNASILSLVFLLTAIE